ncbi:MAG: hypothetical protein IJK64_03895 [Clostridia bacterium]|nr:hypothetical protein [Clostridia bacterium]
MKKNKPKSHCIFDCFRHGDRPLYVDDWSWLERYVFERRADGSYALT